MMQDMANDPSTLVQPELRPHVHLVSSFKCESKGDPFNFDAKQIAGLLKEAAAETKGNNESWCWKMLEAPRDRTAIIVWQSPQQLQGRQFPSDGYIWADPEEAHTEHVDSFKLECYKHRSGYVPPYEQYTLHARSRYHLVPVSPSQGLQGCDPCLWLVLYHRADKSRTIHARRIPPMNFADQKPALEQRRLIFQNGMPKSKDFVWEDRSHWPELRLPQSQAPYRPHGPNLISRGQQGTYMAGQQLIDPRTGQPASKRMKQGTSGSPYNLPDGEDDGGSGDVMDILTPRDISRVRFKQHSEWMEEIYASPYAVSQIHPVSIGLGRTGELAKLSSGLDSIDTPVSAKDVTPAKRIDSEQFNKYMQNAADRIAELRIEITKAKERHGDRIAFSQKCTLLREAEKKLRGSVQFVSHNDRFSNQGAERDAPDRASTQKDIDAASERQIDEVEEVIRNIEQSVNKHVIAAHHLTMINRGGLEEKARTPVESAEDAAMNDSGVLTKQAERRLSPNTDFVAVNSPTMMQSFPAAVDDVQGITTPEDDYVMVDKDQQGQSQDPEPPVITSGETGVGDEMGGDEFLNFEADGNEDNFDSMFTDTIGTVNGIGTPDDAAMEGLDVEVGQQTDAENQNAVDSLSGQLGA